MKSLNNCSVNGDKAGARVGSRPSVGAGDPRVNEFDKLAVYGLPSTGEVESSI